MSTELPAEPTAEQRRQSGAHGGRSARDLAAFVVLLSGMPMMGMMFSVLMPVLPTMVEHFGSSEQGVYLAQMLMTMPSIGAMVGGLGSGWALDRLGVRPVLFGSLAVYAAVGAIGLMTEDPYILLPARLIMGLVATGAAAATTMLIGSRYSGAERARVVGFQAASASFSSLLAVLGAGALGDAWGWQAPFGLYLVALLVLLLAVFSIPRVEPQVAADGTGGFGALKPLAWVYVMLLGLYVMVFMMTVQAPLLLAEHGAANPSQRSVVIALNSVASIVFAMNYGAIRRRLGSRGVFCLCLLLLGGGCMLAGSVQGLVATAAGTAITSCGNGLLSPYISGLVLERSPPEARGRAVGMMITASYVASFANPFVVTPIGHEIGLDATFVLAGAIMAGLGVLSLAVTRGRAAA